MDLKKKILEKVNHHDVDGGALCRNGGERPLFATSFVSRVVSYSFSGVKRSLALEDEWERSPGMRLPLSGDFSSVLVSEQHPRRERRPC